MTGYPVSKRILFPTNCAKQLKILMRKRDETYPYTKHLEINHRHECKSTYINFTEKKKSMTNLCNFKVGKKCPRVQWLKNWSIWISSKVKAYVPGNKLLETQKIWHKMWENICKSRIW